MSGPCRGDTGNEEKAGRFSWCFGVYAEIRQSGKIDLD